MGEPSRALHGEGHVRDAHVRERRRGSPRGRGNGTRSPLTTALAMALGNAAIYVVGLAWLARFVGVEAALMPAVKAEATLEHLLPFGLRADVEEQRDTVIHAVRDAADGSGARGSRQHGSRCEEVERHARW